LLILFAPSVAAFISTTTSFTRYKSFDQKEDGMRLDSAADDLATEELAVNQNLCAA
jgi:hypothetical protein